jgi:ferredoxin
MVIARWFDAVPNSRKADADSLLEPTGFVCHWCDEPVKGNLACDGCGACHTHCPFCGNCDGAHICDHLLQDDGDEDTIYSILEGMGLPEWPDDDDSRRVEGELYLDDAFGDLRDLVEDDMFGNSPAGMRSLMPEIVGRITAPVSVFSWFCDKPMVSLAGCDYYTDAPVQAMREIEAIVARLVEGFGVLNAKLEVANPDRAPLTGAS